MVCAEGDLPDDNVDLSNGRPVLIVCGGPLHVRPGGADPPAPDLDGANCTMYPFPCGGGATCDDECSWDSTEADGGGESLMAGGGGPYTVPAEPLPSAERMASMLTALGEQIDTDDLVAMLQAEAEATADPSIEAMLAAMGG